MLEGDEPDFVEGSFAARVTPTLCSVRSKRGRGAAWTRLDTTRSPDARALPQGASNPQARAKENGAGYRISPSTKIIADNFATLKRVAAA